LSELTRSHLTDGALLVAYRPNHIKMSRLGFGWSAYLILRDDGLDGIGGLDLEQGPYYGITYRRAWRRAFKAAGRRLWDLPRDGLGER
jgi:hypothetical protein